MTLPSMSFVLIDHLIIPKPERWKFCGPNLKFGIHVYVWQHSIQCMTNHFTSVLQMVHVDIPVWSIGTARKV